MKSRRKIERERAKRDARDRLRAVEQPEETTEAADEEDIDLRVARSVLGYDA